MRSPISKVLALLRAGASQFGRWLFASDLPPNLICRALVTPGEVAER